MSISGKMSVGAVTMESTPRSRRPWCIDTFRSITDSGGACDEPEPLCRQAGCGHALLPRSEEHTSELQSQSNLVCRLLLEKKKKNNYSLHQLSLIVSYTHD